MVTIVHDAGQFFACVGVEEALSAAARVLDLAQSITGRFYASVFPTCQTLHALGNINI